MLVLPTSQYMQLGELTLYLANAEEGWPIHGPDMVLDSISRFINWVNDLRLPRTHETMMDLIRVRDRLSTVRRERGLSKAEAKELADTVSRIREMMHAESEGQLACVLIDNKHGADKLFGDVRYLMSPEVFDAMPESARRDFSEAGRAIVFEMPNAAAFHLARGLESVLRAFYRHCVKSRRIADLRWGPMVSDLLLRLDPPPKDLLEELDALYAMIGDPSRQPDRMFTHDEVRDLFTTCADAAMKLVAAAAQPAPGLKQYDEMVSESIELEPLEETKEELTLSSMNGAGHLSAPTSSPAAGRSALRALRSGELFS